jgi:hypothetical protein
LSAKKKAKAEAQKRAGVEKTPVPQRESALTRFLRGRWMALWVVLLLAAFAAQAITSMAQKSATYDETAHLPAGWTYLTTGDYRLNAEHPPLAKMIAALPLLFIKVSGAFDSEGWREGKEWDYGWEFLFSGRNDANTVMFWGRLSMVLLSLCLGLLIFFWARKLYGNGAGLFALLLFAFCPNLIAHGSLTNTDVVITFFFLLTLFCFDRATRLLSPLNALLTALLTGVALGLALLTKFTAPLLLPIMFVIAVVRMLDRRPIEFRFGRQGLAVPWRGKAVAFVVLFAVILPLAYGVLWAGYRFRFSAFAEGGVKPLWYGQQAKYDESRAYDFLYNNRLLPQAYLEGFRYVRATAGRGSFLDGEHNWDPYAPHQPPRYWPHYFIMTTLYKTPVPMLIFLVVAAGGAWWLSRKTWRQEVPLIAAMVIYFGVASLGNMNIGHRHILPVIPLAFIFVSKIPNYLHGRQRSDAITLGLIFIFLSAWYVYGTVSVYPNYLAYFNEIAGGPEHGAEHLTDSNIDWGQDLILLKKYMDENHIKEIHLDYFGSADPRYYGIKFKVFAMNYPLLPKEQSQSLPTTAESGITRDDYIAISVTNLEETYRIMGPLFKIFRDREPIAKIGYSIYLYKAPFTAPPMKPGEFHLSTEDK